MISRTRATVSSVWEVDSLPGRGSSSKDWRPLLKREYHSNVFDRLRQDSPKAACRVSYVSAPVFPRRKQIYAHTLLHFSLHCEMRRTLQVDVHWKASTQRMRGGTDFRFCTYTWTELPHVPLCCHFATYYSFPEKKISPRIKWSAHVRDKWNSAQKDCFIYRIQDYCGNDHVTVCCSRDITWEDQAFVAVSFLHEVKMTQLTQKFPVCMEPKGHWCVCKFPL